MSTEQAKQPEPTVKLNPDFKLGETVTHKGARTEHKILNIDFKKKTVRLSGVATLLTIDSIEKSISPPTA
jgi:hypothetical protein